MHTFLAISLLWLGIFQIFPNMASGAGMVEHFLTPWCLSVSLGQADSINEWVCHL